MKLMLVAPMVPRADGHGAIPLLLHAQIAGLRERHELTLVTAVGDEPGEAEAARRLVEEGLEIHAVDRRRPPPGPPRRRRRRRMAATWLRGDWPWRTVWFAAPGVQAEIDRLAARRRFDLIAVEDSSMAVFRLPADVPAVLTEHEVRRPRRIRWNPGRAPQDWPRRAFEELDWRRWEGFQRAVWQRFDLLQTFSRRDAATVRELAPELGERLRVNPFGLTPPPPADFAREEAGTLLFAGNFTHQPNRDAARWLVAEILPAVRARAPGARLRLVGSSPPHEVRMLAGAHVEVVADPAAIEPHLEAASVVLAPVRTGGGMRMKVLHALACGKPVVTTSRGAEGYAGLQAPLPFVVADSPAEIAGATAELLADGAKRERLGQRAREFAIAHHSPAAWASRLESVYEEARYLRRPADG
jgi:glycosyltransferase involved in cell wall biosynthesis